MGGGKFGNWELGCLPKVRERQGCVSVNLGPVSVIVTFFQTGSCSGTQSEGQWCDLGSL